MLRRVRLAKERVEADKEELAACRRRQQDLEAQVAKLQSDLALEHERRVEAEGELENCQAILRRMKGSRPKRGDDLILASLGK